MGDEFNPYAPPGIVDPPSVRAKISNYESERRGVFVCILLTLATLGLYQTIWLVRRQRFLDSLDADAKLGSVLPWFPLGLSLCNLALTLVVGKGAAPLESLISAAAALTFVIAIFRVRTILRSDFARTGRFLDVSTVATFFLHIYYLQYKINKAASTPPARKKKKRKKAAEVDAQSSGAVTSS